MKKVQSNKNIYVIVFLMVLILLSFVLINFNDTKKEADNIENFEVTFNDLKDSDLNEIELRYKNLVLENYTEEDIKEMIIILSPKQSDYEKYKLLLNIKGEVSNFLYLKELDGTELVIVDSLVGLEFDSYLILQNYAEIKKNQSSTLNYTIEQFDPFFLLLIGTGDLQSKMDDLLNR